MTLKAAASGFVIFLLSVPVVQGPVKWGVTYPSTLICGLKGSTVDIHSIYTYPSRINDGDTKVEKTLWFTKGTDNEPEDLSTDQNYAGRLHFQCNKSMCTLRITDLKESDSAVYKFRFITNQQVGRHTGIPGVTLSVTDLQVQLGRSSTQLECHSRCNVPDQSSYIWYKNGQKMDEGTASPTVFVKVSGNYSCAIKGHESHRSKPFHAIIDTPKVPSVSVCPSGELMEGSSVSVTCSSDANPAVTYTWHKKKANPDLQSLSNEPLLVFRSIQSSDSGEYICTIENLLAKRTSEPIFIDVKYAPKSASVSVSPSGEIMEGSSVSLTCSSDANPEANYTWYKKNQTLLQGRESIYNFTSISSEDRGIYYCKSENQYGHNSSSIFINVQYSPKLPSVSVSPSGEVMEGSSVSLICSSDANPTAKYTWYKENQTLLQGRESIYSFTSISSEDRGIYYCKSENQYGHNSSSIFINVQYSPKLPSVSVSPSGEIMEGSSVSLTCSSDANPEANYTWYKKNQTLLQGRESIYSFTSISSEDSGIYYCKSENQYGHNSSSIFINVQYSPKLPSVSVSPSGEVMEGSSVSLICSSDANPEANYTWYKKNQTLLQGRESIYNFTSISSEDSGIYYCKSENQYGHNSSTIFINVQYAPKLPTVSVSPSNEIMEGNTVNLTCSSDANPASNYTWYKENGDSPKASGQIFTITNIRPEHSGNYYCEAQNKRGHHSATLHLTVVTRAWKLIAAFTVPVIFFIIILIPVLLRIIKKRAFKQPSEPEERPDNSEQILQADQQDVFHYATVRFSRTQADPVYSNISLAQPQRYKEKRSEEEEMVEYAAVTFNSASTTWRTRHQEAVENPAALYSTVNKLPKQHRKWNL